MASAAFEERGRRRGRSGGGGMCMPKLGRRCGRGASPMSLMDRIREVVFRLIMLSAVSKGTSSSRPAPPCRDVEGGVVRRGYPCYSQDSYNSEALADCIEFIKKSASTDGGSSRRDSAASADGVDFGPTHVLPVTY